MYVAVFLPSLELNEQELALPQIEIIQAERPNLFASDGGLMLRCTKSICRLNYVMHPTVLSAMSNLRI
jgi:hypothetical protein